MQFLRKVEIRRRRLSSRKEASRNREEEEEKEKEKEKEEKASKITIQWMIHQGPGPSLNHVARNNTPAPRL